MTPSPVANLKILTAAAVIVITGGALLDAQGANSTVVCHAHADGSFTPLSVNANALKGHFAHGDGSPLGALPGGDYLFSDSCDVAAIIEGTWFGESISFDAAEDCGQDLNEMRLTLTQSGSDASGELWTKIIESFYPPDVGMERTRILTSGDVSGNTFTFTYGPAGSQRVGTATIAGASMTGTIIESASCPLTTFTLVRQ